MGFRVILSDILKFGSACLAVLFSLVLSSCGESDPGLFGKTEKVPPGYFVRQRVDYVMTDTGEPFTVEFVQACGGRLTRTRHAGSIAHAIITPQRYFKATPDKKSAVRVYNRPVCRDKGPDGLSDYLEMGEHFIPKLLWYPDINNLSFAWGYLTPKAYESPVAKLKPVNVTLERVTREDWLAWRDKAEREYEQIGALPGPWGYDVEVASQERKAEIRAQNGGFDHASRCSAMVKVKLPDSEMDALLEIWPEDGRRYWDLTNKRDYDYTTDLKPALDIIDNGRKKPEGVPYLFSVGGRLNKSTTFLGFGNKRNSSVWNKPDAAIPVDVYPVLPHSLSMPNGKHITQPQDNYFKKILEKPEWNGFGACGYLAPVDNIWVRKYPVDTAQIIDPQMHNRQYQTMINNELILSYGAKGGSFKFIDKSGFLYQR